MTLKKQSFIILLGSNIGERKQNLVKAISGLQKQVGTISLVSNIYETQAWGNTNQQFFLNMALKIHTFYTPLLVLKKCLQIELEMGRKRVVKWGERNIDIDILYVNNLVLNKPELVIPHPYIADRLFTLVCLNDINPFLIDPVTKLTVNEMLVKCKDNLEVKKHDK